LGTGDFPRLTRWWAWPLIGVTSGLALAALAILWRRKFYFARATAIGTATLILFGWSMAQYPYFVVPDITIANTAAPAITLRLLLIALVAGAVILLPSLYFLFYLFKGAEASPEDSGDLRQ